MNVNEKEKTMEFSCLKKECPYDGKGSYMLKISSEACVDEHNCATLFCPHCKSELTRMEPDEEEKSLPL